MFARFAYPPNALGYCGPDDARGMLERLEAGEDAAGLRAAARRFEGAWPYLQLIAGANRIADPLDPRVVEAYWIGNGLLDRVDGNLLADSLDERFRRRVGPRLERLVAPAPAGARPHHSFHVFGVYPWLGLIRSGVVEQPLRVLDRCRIRWGQVEAIVGDQAVVRCRLLTWEDGALTLGAPQSEQVTLGDDGLSLAGPLGVGDWCALHWDWVCAPLTPVQLEALRTWTVRTLETVNGTAFPAPAAVLS
jgi:hypothetical protein